MKVWHFYILFVAAVSSAVLLFSEKAKEEPNEIDEFSDGLAGVKPFLNKNSVITFESLHRPVEHLIWSRYIFFPVQLDRIEDVRHDTALFVLDKYASDSSISAIVRDGRVLWTNNDDKNRYLLIANGKN